MALTILRSLVGTQGGFTLTLDAATKTGVTTNAEALLDHADQRLYAAKQAGRNCTRASDD